MAQVLGFFGAIFGLAAIGGGITLGVIGDWDDNGGTVFGIGYALALVGLVQCIYCLVLGLLTAIWIGLGMLIAGIIMVLVAWFTMQKG